MSRPTRSYRGRDASGSRPSSCVSRARPLEEHEVREEDDRDRPDDCGDDAAHDVEEGLAETEHPTGPLLLDRLTDAIDDLVLVLQPAERPLAGRDVVDEVGHGVREVRHLRDERRDHEEPDPRQHEEREHEHEGGRIAAPQPAPFERLHSRVQRGSEQRRDEDPGQDVPGEKDEHEHEPDEHGDAEDEEDRPRTHGHDAHLGGRHDHVFGTAPRVPGARCAPTRRLRATLRAPSRPRPRSTRGPRACRRRSRCRPACRSGRDRRG